MDGQQALARAGEFPVELPVFTGPFRLLADLILEGEVDVCDVPVARVTDRFLAAADQAEGWTLEEATWFLAICAVLLELKIGRLLPREERLDEEDLLGGSPDLTYARSLELRAFRKVAEDLARRIGEAALLHSREAGPPEEFAHLYPDVLEKVTPQDMAETAAALLRPPPTVDLSHVAPIRVSVADALEDVAGRLSDRPETRFRELVADCEEPIQVVVRFLALLELFKDGKVGLKQAKTFGEIEVKWEG